MYYNMYVFMYLYCVCAHTLVSVKHRSRLSSDRRRSAHGEEYLTKLHSSNSMWMFMGLRFSTSANLFDVVCSRVFVLLIAFRREFVLAV